MIESVTEKMDVTQDQAGLYQLRAAVHESVYFAAR